MMRPMQFGPHNRIPALLAIALTAVSGGPAAADALLKALTHKPDHPETLYKLGLALIEAERVATRVCTLSRRWCGRANCSRGCRSCR